MRRPPARTLGLHSTAQYDTIQHMCKSSTNRACVRRTVLPFLSSSVHDQSRLVGHVSFNAITVFYKGREGGFPLTEVASAPCAFVPRARFSLRVDGRRADVAEELAVHRLLVLRVEVAGVFVGGVAVAVFHDVPAGLALLDLEADRGKGLLQHRGWGGVFGLGMGLGLRLRSWFVAGVP